MKILAVDTSAVTCSVAVMEDDLLLAELTVNDGQSHARHVMEMIQKVLAGSGLAVGDLDGFAVSRGPGSFTGLRIGISSIKGLALATGKPMAGISCLEALATQAGTGSCLICPMMDARKGEVYFARFSGAGERLNLQGREMVLPPQAAIASIDRPCLFVGPGALQYRETIAGTLGEKALFAPANQHPIRASTLACLARRRFAVEDADDAGSFVPVYIRPSDAERHAKREGLE